MRIPILIVLSVSALTVILNRIFAASCTDRIATSPWCMANLATVIDLALIGAIVGLIVYSRRRR
jgi:hypothetical protein